MVGNLAAGYGPNIATAPAQLLVPMNNGSSIGVGATQIIPAAAAAAAGAVLSGNLVPASANRKTSYVPGQVALTLLSWAYVPCIFRAPPFSSFNVYPLLMIFCGCTGTIGSDSPSARRVGPGLVLKKIIEKFCLLSVQESLFVIITYQIAKGDPLWIIVNFTSAGFMFAKSEKYICRWCVAQHRPRLVWWFHLLSAALTAPATRLRRSMGRFANQREMKSEKRKCRNLERPHECLLKLKREC